MSVRTTVTLDDDVAVALEEIRSGTSLGVSEAVNVLARRGVAAWRAAGRHREPFRQRTASIGLRVDVSNTREVLDLLDADPGPRTGPATGVDGR